MSEENVGYVLLSIYPQQPPTGPLEKNIIHMYCNILHSITYQQKNENENPWNSGPVKHQHFYIRENHPTL
jgi:hypothetical protein